MKKCIAVAFLCFFTFSVVSAKKVMTGNPIIPGYYADPSIIQDGDKFYIFTTLDPWGGEELGLWESEDLVNWKLIPLNWPTLSQCRSEKSNENKVWAPSVIKGNDGKFHMFVSVGSEVYAGVAIKPTGPWRNAVSGNRPLISTQSHLGIHTIDAEAFIDTDGQAYLYWGSGLNWVNGHCMVAKINPEMNELTELCKDITPEHYFEAPYMFKRKGLYYLTYSEGLCTDHTYRVEYSTSKTPYGPFTLGKNSPILSSDFKNGILGTGHHTFLTHKGKMYVVYHRISPNTVNELHRQICIDLVVFDKKGAIKKIKPTNSGVNLFNRKINEGALPVVAVSASSSAGTLFIPESATDASYATLWKPDSLDVNNWLKVDFGKVKQIRSCETRFEYPNRVSKYKIEYSTDNVVWSLFADRSQNAMPGSPMIDTNNVSARYIRIVLPTATSGNSVNGIWEFVVRKK